MHQVLIFLEWGFDNITSIVLKAMFYFGVCTLTELFVQDCFEALFSEKQLPWERASLNKTPLL